MRKHVLVTVVLLFGALLLAACGDTQVPTGAIAAVGDGVVTQGQFDSIMDQAKAQAKAAKATFPKKGSYNYNQYAAQVVEYLVSQEVINQAAAKKDFMDATVQKVLKRDLKEKERLAKPLKVTDKEVAESIAQFEEAYGGEKKLDEILKQQGMTRQDFKSFMRNQILSQHVAAHVVKGVTVAEQKIKDYYEKNIDDYQQPETRSARHILVKSKEKALEVRALLVADDSEESWKKLAQQYSIDPGSKETGGDLGEVTPGTMVPKFDKAAFALKVNVISQPVQTQFGWHIIQVTEITAAGKQSYADVKDDIKTQLLDERQRSVWAKWLEIAKTEAKIAYAKGFDPVVLRKTKPESPSPSPSPSGGASGSASPSASAQPSASPSATGTE